MLYPVDVGVGFVEAAKRIHVFVGDIPDRPSGYEVEQVGLVHALGVGLLLNQPALLFEPVPQAGVGEGLEHAHHRGGNPGAAHETHDPIAGAGLLPIKANDETRHHSDPVGGDSIYRFLQGTAGVLVLAGD